MSLVADELREVTATRYVTPLREGGSLPGLVEGDDDGLYVVKFRGAVQGLRALVAEVIVGELARRLGLLVPDLVAVEIDPVNDYAHYGLGLCLLRTGDRVGARRHLKLAVAMRPLAPSRDSRLRPGAITT